MPPLNYLGPAISKDSSLGYKDYADVAAGQIATSTQVDNQISSRTSGYATQAYADSADNSLALKSYVDSQDAAKLKVALKDVANGYIGLDSSGYVPASYLGGTTARKTQAQYSTANVVQTVTSVSDTTVLTQIATMTITANNGDVPRDGPWFPLVFGYWEVRTVGGAPPVSGAQNYPLPWIEVRVGGPTGQLVASGYGAMRSDWHPLNITPDLSASIPATTTSTTLYFYARCAGGANSSYYSQYSSYLSQAIAVIWPARN